MMRNVTLAFAILIATLPTAAAATAWGTLQVMAEREWTTEKEPRPRITKFRWIEPGKVLEARHGFVSRLQFGEAKFADTVQRFVLDPKTDTINVTYTYEDGRPPLKAMIKVQPDGSLIESFTDAKGVKKRNIYRSSSLALNAIERQEMKGGAWASLGTTRKAGLTQFEIAENKRRAEEARQMAIAQENARRTAEQARRNAEEARQQAAYEQEQANQQSTQQGMGMNMLDVLNGLANSIQQENQQQQAQFERRMRNDQRDQSSSSSGAIVMSSGDSTPSSNYAPSTPTPSAPAKSWDEVTTYYNCIGHVKKRGPPADVTVAIYYGIVTSPRMDINGARDLFRRHTGSDQASDTENVGASCSPRNSRAEAVSDMNQNISRDAGGSWRQITGIELSL